MLQSNVISNIYLFHTCYRAMLNLISIISTHMLQSNVTSNIYHFHTCYRAMLYLISFISRQMLQSYLPEDNRMSTSVLMYEVSVQRLPVFLPSTFFDSISRALYKGLFCPKSFFPPFTHSIYFCSVLHLPKLHCVFVQE